MIHLLNRTFPKLVGLLNASGFVYQDTSETRMETRGQPEKAVEHFISAFREDLAVGHVAGAAPIPFDAQNKDRDRPTLLLISP